MPQEPGRGDDSSLSQVQSCEKAGATVSRAQGTLWSSVGVGVLRQDTGGEGKVPGREVNWGGHPKACFLNCGSTKIFSGLQPAFKNKMK